MFFVIDESTDYLLDIDDKMSETSDKCKRYLV